MVRYFLISPWLQNLKSYTYFGRYTDWRLGGGEERPSLRGRRIGQDEGKERKEGE